MAIQYLSVSWNDYHASTQKLAEKILSAHIRLDEIVAIARGGLTLGLILSDFLQLPISTITIQSYTDIKKQGVMKITNKLGKHIKDKHILLVDDNAETGRTFQRAIGYLQRLKPASITTAVLFYKPHSKYRPDYVGMQTKLWTLLPHELTEWVMTFTRKMETEGKSKMEIQQFLESLGYTDDQIAFVRRHYLHQ